MRHLEFEELLLEQDELPQNKRSYLEAHLRECEQCSQFSDRLGAVETILHSAVNVPAPKGFTARFQARVQKARQRRQMRLLILTTMLTIAGVLSGLGLLVYALVSYGASVFSWFLKTLNQVYWLGTVVDVAADTTILFLETLIEQMPLLTWMAVSTAMSLVALTWISSLYRLSYRSIRRE